MATPPPTILARTAAGAGWMIAWRFTSRLLGVASTLVLLRLLTPGDFGLVTLAFSFTAAAEAFTTLGIEVQLIRSRDPRPALYDTAFTLNVLRALLVAAAIAAGSLPVADWFGEPRLREVLITIALHILIRGCANVRTVAFDRDLRFNMVFLVQVVPRLVQVIAGVVLAVVLRSYWALILGIMASSVTTLVFSYALIPVRPRPTLSAWRELLSVSVWTWAFNVLTVFRDRMEMFVIGRAFDVIKAGIYAVAHEFATLPLSEVMSQIGNVSMPGLAATVRASGAGHAAVAFRRILALAVLLSVSMGVGMSLVAGPFVALALGPRWEEVAPLTAIIAVLVVPMGPGLVAAALLTAHGRLRSICAVTALAAALRAGIVLAVTRRYGLAGIATGMGAVVALEAALLLALACRVAALTPWGLAAVCWRPVVAAAAMVAALRWAGLAWLPPPERAGEAALALLAAVSLGAAVFAGSSALLWVAAGRPASAEQDLLLILRRLLAGLGTRLRPQEGGRG
jgi:lipopolysaccharide exporter